MNPTTAPRSGPSLHVRSLRTRMVRAPMRFALGTSAARVTTAPLLLVDLETAEGVTGRSYLFCYRDSGCRAVAAVLEDAAKLAEGQPVAPVDLAASLGRRFALLGVTGVARMALAALDIALWDALATAAGLPLAVFLGGTLARVPAYNSDGLGLMPAADAAREALELLAPGFDAVKLRLGHPTLARDLEVATAVRRALPDSATLMVDFNQALTVPEALRRGRALAALELHWIEEPIRHGDLHGNARLTRELATPVQLGENLDGHEGVLDAVEARASDYLMLDVARVGGVTGWLRAAGIAAARGVPVSSHLMPEISAHLLAVTPGAHWLEYVSWAEPLLVRPLRVASGHVEVPAGPGIGLEWREDVVERLRFA